MRSGPNTRRLRSRSNANRRGNPSRPHNFESNGPDVKVRGNAQQVVEKYLQLARDATTAGNPVMAENYFQHAEHYQRIQTANGSDRSDRGDRGEQIAGNGGSQPQTEPAPGAEAEADAEPMIGASQPAVAPAKAAEEPDISAPNSDAA